MQKFEAQKEKFRIHEGMEEKSFLHSDFVTNNGKVSQNNIA